MSWIKIIPSEKASPPLAELYSRLADRETGRMANILGIHSLDPATLQTHHALYHSVMRPTKSLRGADREIIAVAVSQANDCHY